MTARRHISRTMRVRIYEAAGGCCYLCGLRIQAGQRWQVDHVRALALLGDDDEQNMKPAHASCHQDKTRADVARISKADRQKASHIGAKISKHRWPCGKSSPWRKKINGEVVRR